MSFLTAVAASVTAVVLVGVVAALYSAKQDKKFNYDDWKKDKED